MSTSVPETQFSLTVGGSRLGEIPPELRRVLVFPGANALIKQESGTVIWRVQMALPAEARTGVVKLYRGRGLWSRLCAGALPSRVQREFEALCILADGGVPCSQPLAWGRGFAPDHGHFELLVTREIPAALSIKESMARGDPPGAAAYLPLFDALRRMHDRGVYHGALWPKNILLTRTVEGSFQFYLIDLARAIRFPGTIRGTTMARFDLLSLLYSLDAAFDSEAMLRHYGYEAAEAREFATRARRYRSSRHLRNRLALAFQLRALVAWR